MILKIDFGCVLDAPADKFTKICLPARLCFFILTGKTNIERQKEGMIKKFWETGTNPDRNKRFHSVRELLEAVKAITDDKA